MHLGGPLGAVVENGYVLVVLALVALLPARAQPPSRNPAYAPAECAGERPPMVSHGHSPSQPEPSSSG